MGIVSPDDAVIAHMTGQDSGHVYGYALRGPSGVPDRSAPLLLRAA